MVVPLFYFYDSLTRLALYTGSGRGRARAACWRRSRPTRPGCTRWADARADELSPQVAACRGRARACAGPTMAMRANTTTRPSRLRRSTAISHEEALAHELAGRFYLARGHTQFAQVCLHNAHYAFRRWGALAKVRDVETRYPQFFMQTPLVTGTTARISTGVSSTSGRTVVGALDLTSVIKASQAISGEIVLARLLQTLMKIVIENAGAQRGYLLLEKNGGFSIEAVGTVDQDQAVVLPVGPAGGHGQRFRADSAALDHQLRGPHARERGAARRDRGEPVYPGCLPGAGAPAVAALRAAAQPGQAGRHRLSGEQPDRRRLHARSAGGAQLLAAQTAISIENASLYANIERSERKYRTLFEHSRDAIFVSGPAGEILDANPASIELLALRRGRAAAHEHRRPVRLPRGSAALAGGDRARRLAARFRGHGAHSGRRAARRPGDGQPALRRRWRRCWATRA